jgi:ABC-2 type transport system ATP-binding protein
MSLAALPEGARVRGGEVSEPESQIVFENVSKFYGEVLGVNRVNLTIPAGITGLVGPNGSGKTTLMNLMTGLIRPSRGHISILGVKPEEPERLFRFTGYCTQFDSFPRGMTGYQFVYSYLLLHGKTDAEAAELAWRAIERVRLSDAAHRKIAAYSKGMRQRIKLAQALAHLPKVLVLDEPLNGLDPLVRAETIALFRSLAEEGLYVIISSHILHEVDAISDQVILLSSGYVVAEGQIHGVRTEVEEHPMQILIRCAKPALVASQVFALDTVMEARVHNDGKGLLVRTRDPERFYLMLNRLVVEGVDLESVAPADDDVHSVYEYLIGPDGGSI